MQDELTNVSVLPSSDTEVVIDSIHTKDYYNEEHFYMAYKRLNTASHWVDPVTGEEVKLTHNFKAIYHHKLDQYRAFSKQGKPYKESHQRVADIMGVGLKTVEEVAIPLMKRMGLIIIEEVRPRNYHTTMFELKFIKGMLVNPKLKSHNKKKVYKKDKDFTYDKLKNLEHNKKQIEKLRGKNDEKVFTFTESELRELMKNRDKEVKD